VTTTYTPNLKNYRFEKKNDKIPQLKKEKKKHTQFSWLSTKKLDFSKTLAHFLVEKIIGHNQYSGYFILWIAIDFHFF